MTPLSAVVEHYWTWPPVLAILLWVLRKSPRGNGVPFVVLGTLVGYGVQWVVSYFVVQLPAWVPENSPEGQQLVRVMALISHRTAVISAVCALPFVLWLRPAISRYQANAIQNRGEVRLSREVKSRFRPPDYHLLNHITLRLEDGTTQIDHVLVSRFGVFVIETKDYNGWLFAGAKDRNWTQVLYRAKCNFQNPIRQNYRHVCAVRELLEFLEPDVVHPAVVFTGSAVFKTDIPDGVFTLPKFVAYVESHGTEIMSVNRVQFCVGRLEATRLAITQATDVEHVLELRRRHGIND
jgi:hypothetical protein